MHKTYGRLEEIWWRRRAIPQLFGSSFNQSSSAYHQTVTHARSEYTALLPPVGFRPELRWSPARITDQVKLQDHLRFVRVRIIVTHRRRNRDVQRHNVLAEAVVVEEGSYRACSPGAVAVY